MLRQNPVVNARIYYTVRHKIPQIFLTMRDGVLRVNGYPYARLATNI
jgi:hypothetical protein